jgi:TonB family protein
MAMLLNGAGVLAQGTRQEKPRQPAPPDGDVIIERQVFEAPVPGGMRERVPMPPELIIGRGGEDFTFNFLASEMSFEGKVVKGEPYSAEAVTETTQTLSDGNHISRKTTTNVYRDGEGRTRRDQSVGAIGPFASAGDAPQTVFINDPVAGVNYILEPRTKTARKMSLTFDFKFKHAPLAPGTPLPPGVRGNMKMMPAPPGGPIKKVEPIYPAAAKAAGVQGTVKVEFVINAAGEVESARALEGHELLQPAAIEAVKQWRFEPIAQDGGNKTVSRKGIMVFNFVIPEKDRDKSGPAVAPPAAQGMKQEFNNESLGKQVIEGVEAEGTRSTITIPAGAVGNERPIQMVSEKWYSPELQTVIMSKHSDPRFGETTYRLTNINRSEPARSLFEVPADYTVKEGPMGGGVMLMQHEKREVRQEEK